MDAAGTAQAKAAIERAIMGIAIGRAAKAREGSAETRREAEIAIELINFAVPLAGRALLDVRLVLRWAEDIDAQIWDPP